MKRKILMLTVLLMFVLGGVVMARQNEMGACPKQDWPMKPMMFSNLNLTPEQTEKLRSLMETFYKDTAPLRNQKFECRTELKLLWMQTKPDPEKIKAKQKELHDLKWEMLEKATDYRLSLRNILTPEQLSKFIIQSSRDHFPPYGKENRHGYHEKRSGVNKRP